MAKIQILDCTLRDGGYVNGWHFGKECIHNICENLVKAGINIIEVGFLTDMPHTADDSLFSNAAELESIVANKKESLFAGMIALGEKELDATKLGTSKETGLDIVRITFHGEEAEIQKALNYAEILMKKGYKVCMQPIGTTFYTDSDLVALINKVNKIKPFAFYLVDTLGTLYKDELLRFIGLIDKHLEQGIKLGFHSHNNLQMSFSNAQTLADYETKREFIVDSSLYGMGRGAGNLCTELIARYLNDTNKASYFLTPILDCIDNDIFPLSMKYSWGYNVHYYMSAIHNCHPNYAAYLMNMQTLTMNEVNLLLQNLPKEKRHIFDKRLIEDLYHNFQNNYIDDENAVEKLCENIGERDVLVLAPGSSLLEYGKSIKKHIESKNPIVIAINSVPEMFNPDYVFVSNRKRLLALNYDKNNSKIIVTSNLPKLTDDFIQVDYNSLCDSEFEQDDNAGMMLIRLLSNIGKKKVELAGFDGFSSNANANYFVDTIADHSTTEIADKKTVDIANQLSKIMKAMKIKFLTPSKYENLLKK